MHLENCQLFEKTVILQKFGHFKNKQKQRIISIYAAI